MGMTITEKILAAHAGRPTVAPGDNIWCNVDVLLTLAGGDLIIKALGKLLG